MKKKRWTHLVVVFVMLLLIGGLSFFFYQKHLEMDKRKQIELVKENNSKKEASIKEHYAPQVAVLKECSIYQKQKDKYQKIGRIQKDEILSLAETSDFMNSYFLVKDFNFYIPASCVLKSDKKRVVDTRYQYYVPFPKKITTKDKVTLYRDDKKVYDLFSSIVAQVIKQDEDGYYVEYFGELFKIDKSDVLSVSDIEDNSFYAKDIPVTAYHFIYQEDDYGCTGVICHPISQIRSHFAYLKENHYFTITTAEMEAFLDGEIRLPEKSILVTIDDGDRAENVIPLLEEFQVNATLFLITAWYSPSQYQSPYLELASHTHELHEGGKCPGGQGSGLKCLDKTKIVDDLITSRLVLNNTVAFCYPLYEYNTHAVNAVREAGFHLGFIGGQRRATLKSEKLLIPRITIFRSTSLDEYIEIVS